MAVEPTSICRTSDSVVARKIAGELVIIPLGSGIGDLESELFSLNSTGEAIWDNLNGSNSVQDIATILAGKYEAPQSAIEEDVKGLVSALLDRGLVVESPGA